MLRWTSVFGGWMNSHGRWLSSVASFSVQFPLEWVRPWISVNILGLSLEDEHNLINQAQFSLWSFELTPCMILYLKIFKKRIKWTVSSFSSSFGALNYCNRIWLKAMSATATEWTVKLFSQLQFPKWTFQLRLIRQEWRKRRKTSVISWQKGKFHLLRKVM